MSGLGTRAAVQQVQRGPTGLAPPVIADKEAQFGRKELEKELRETICKDIATQFMPLVARRRSRMPCSNIVFVLGRVSCVLLSEFFSWRQVEASELAPGDVTELATGDGLPADCRLIE